MKYQGTRVSVTGVGLLAVFIGNSGYKDEMSRAQVMDEIQYFRTQRDASSSHEHNSKCPCAMQLRELQKARAALDAGVATLQQDTVLHGAGRSGQERGRKVLRVVK